MSKPITHRPLMRKGPARTVIVVPGDTFGLWTVIEEVETRGRGRNRCVLCRCACGVQRVVHLTAIRNGHSKGCNACGVRRPLHERFWEKVNKDGPIPAHAPHLGPCWVWRRNGPGYPYIRKDDVNTRASRVAWEFGSGGPTPDGLWVLHKCDNPRCVRYEHLFLGDVHDNNADMDRKGRRAVGERMPTSRLTESGVRTVLRLRSEGLSISAIARRVGVSRGVVLSICAGKAWKHIARPASVTGVSS